MRRTALVAALVAATVLPPTAASRAAESLTAQAVATSWHGWTSSGPNANARLITSPASTEPATRTLQVYPDQVKQTWRGVGASLTDASVQLLSSTPEATARLFDPDRADSARLNWVRLPLSATDFSTARWTFGWNDGTKQLTVPSQAVASTAFLKEKILPLRPDASVAAVSWSAPAAMKSSGTLDGGALSPQSVGAYGRLLNAQADWLVANGVPLEAMSLGNEPDHGTGNYPTMTMTDGQMITLADQVGPGLDQDDVELWAFDHNWNHRPRYDNVINGAPGRFAASAFHCYGGDYTKMSGVGAAPIITECTGTDDTYAGTFWWDMKNLVAGPVSVGSTGLMFWNLSVDENHGPRLGGCSNCRGIIDVHSSTGALTPTPEFYTLAHVSRAADPGASVIGSGQSSGIDYAAFRNPNGEIGIVGHNGTGQRQVLTVAVGGTVGTARIVVEDKNLFTLRGLPEVGAGTVTLPGAAPQVGSAVVPSVSGFGPAPVTLAYQWFADGSPINGATSASFTPSQAQAGTKLTLRVTGSKAGFTPAVVTSAPTPAVVGTAAEQVENTTLPTITGTPQVGTTLSATAGAWSPTGTTTTYQWLAAGDPIGGATASTYTPVSGDVGKPLAVRVTASKPGYTPGIATSSPTTAVTAAATTLTNTALPTVTGSSVAGRTLNGSDGTWTPSPTSFAYQWLRDGTEISGASGRSHTLGLDDVGTRISLRVTASRSGYASVARTSAQTSPVSVGTVANQVAPSIVGTPRIGVRLSAKPGSWTPTPDAFTYQWLVDGIAIKGATASNYVPTPGAAGGKLAVQVTASKPGWTQSSARSARTATVALGIVSNSKAPTVTGTKKVGKVLRAAVGTWTPSGLTYRYQWLRNGKVIKGATKSTYKLPKSARGQRFSVRVTATKNGYAKVVRTSARTSRVR